MHVVSARWCCTVCRGGGGSKSAAAATSATAVDVVRGVVLVAFLFVCVSLFFRNVEA